MFHRHFSALLVLLLAATAFANPRITIDHQKPTVQTRLFDRDNPPPDMIQLSDEEAAFCAYNLGANAAVSYSLRTRDDGRTCEATWTEITFTLTCEITIWLPQDFTPKLQAHEEGHRRIAERVYVQSKSLAEKLARDLAATPMKLDPRRCRESAEAFANTASQDICDQWLKVTGQRAAAVNEAFDRLTDHGRNDLEEDQAIQRAFEEVDKK